MELEDEIELDAESLQAQIDMAMSFTHELVSSWVKPSELSKKRKHADAQKELDEIMRLPAR
jgi:hypothetical protein